MNNQTSESPTDSVFKNQDSSLDQDLLFEVLDEIEISRHVSDDLYINSSLYRDLRNYTEPLTTSTIEHLVSLHYDLQKLRLSTADASKHLQKMNASHHLVRYYALQLQRMEYSLVRPINTYVKESVSGKWALSQYGIGPVLAAGLITHIDITKAPTAGSIWRYAGLDPSLKWNKGHKRPWNPELKSLTWKIGQSFARFASSEQCFYGHLYLQDKLRRNAKNAAGDYAQAAADTLSAKDQLDPSTQAILASGHLPDAQIEAQARRFAVKIFLSHYHAVAYQAHYDKPADLPQFIDHGTGLQELSIPHFPF